MMSFDLWPVYSGEQFRVSCPVFTIYGYGNHLGHVTQLSINFSFRTILVILA